VALIAFIRSCRRYAAPPQSRAGWTPSFRRPDSHRNSPATYRRAVQFPMVNFLRDFHSKAFRPSDAHS
jgi:hypothetical protein